MRELSISECSLREFPAVLTQLQQLEALNASENPLCRLPDQIDRFQRLRALQLVSCGLTEMCPALLRLTSLENLVLRDNRISRIPAEIRALTRLKALNVILCKMTEVPVEVAHLRGLDSLDLNFSPVHQLPLCLASMRSLRKLGVYYCPLKAVSIGPGVSVTPSDLAAVLGDTQQSLEAVLTQAPLKFLHLVQMCYAPQMTLRQTCVSQCVIRGEVALGRLPLHLQQEIGQQRG
eukprot:TRINITY_DN777_c0_g1_i4.p1 TRINITY_DN777_c0_g1~~TRINITY_DN777_c0_g1_i4.p1  ORF type:complete len:234 (+),score=30.27 TRINITY_DN777_c0_g1_i4:721-1422(+)